MGVTIHTTGGVTILKWGLPNDGVITLTATKHIATIHTSSCTIDVFGDFTFVLSEMDGDVKVFTFLQGIRICGYFCGSVAVQRHATDDTSLHNDIGATVDVTVLTTAKHITDHLGVSFDGNNGAVGEGEMFQLAS